MIYTSSKYYHTYAVYRAAKTRCNCLTCRQYKDYGGRGITFEFKSFEEFLKEIGLRPLGPTRFTLERIDNNKGYKPGNVKWATYLEQLANKRPRKDSR